MKMSFNFLGEFQFKVWHQNSEERTWCLNANDNIPEEEIKKEITSESLIPRKGCSHGSSKSSLERNGIRQNHSGERAWRMSTNPQDVPGGVIVIPATSCNNKNIYILENFNEEKSSPRTKCGSKPMPPDGTFADRVSPEKVISLFL